MLGLLKHLVKQTCAFMSRVGICILISTYVMVTFVVDAYLLVDCSSNVWPSDDCKHQQQPCNIIIRSSRSSSCAAAVWRTRGSTPLLKPLQVPDIIISVNPK